MTCSLVCIVFGSISILSGKFPNLVLTGPAYFISLLEQKVHCVLTRLLFSLFHAEQGVASHALYSLSFNFLICTQEVQKSAEILAVRWKGECTCIAKQSALWVSKCSKLSHA